MILATVMLANGGMAGGQQTPTLVERYDLERRAGRFDLPGRLDEVSGLAFSADGRLFAHGDERARIHEILLDEEEGGKRFSLGDPAEPGDFEGIEIVGDRFFIITSNGLLYETRESAEDRGAVPFRRVDTALGWVCEAEGLAYHPAADELLVACKNTEGGGGGRAVVYRLPMSPDRHRPPPLEIPLAPLEALGLDASFHPSGITVDPATGNLVLVAAQEEVILEVAPGGRILSAFQLSKSRHPQPEGIAFGPDGTLYIADEAAGRDNARLTFYRFREDAGGGGGRP